MAVARDLAACLRNWVQLAETIDSLATTEGWSLSFNKQTVPKGKKKMMAGKSSELFHLPGAASSKGIKISEVTVTYGKLTQEDVKKAYELGRSTMPAPVPTSFEGWLNSSSYRVVHEGVVTDIPRKVFIDRAANLLGGTHPMSNFTESEHATWADPYIVDLMNTQVGLWPVPYSILMESAQEIVRVFEPVLI